MFNNKDVHKTIKLCYYILDKGGLFNLIQNFKPYVFIFFNYGAKALNNLCFYINQAQ